MRKRNARGRKKNCAKCGKEIEPVRRGKQAYCLACFAEYQRLHRPKYTALPELVKLKMNARSYLHQYIKRGKIIKQPCEVCGKKEVEAHHEDYSKPLQVRWFCREHHLELHGIKLTA